MPQRRIEDVLRNQKLIHLPPGATVRDAANEMAEHHVSAVVVSDAADHLHGIFTERDMITRVVVPARNPSATFLSEVMTPKPATVAPDQTVRQALQLMDGKNVRHLPVVQGEKVVGIVSMRDFVSDEIHELEIAQSDGSRFAELVW